MAAPRGTKPPHMGKGRPRGAVNKTTADVRVAVALLAQNMVGDLEQWIRRGAKKQPLVAARVLADIFEYHIPKLSRTELTGEGGKPLEVRVVRFGNPSAEQLAAAALSATGVDSARTGNPPSSTLLAPKIGQG